MKIVMFILSVLMLVCVVGMLYGAIIKDSPMHITGITLLSAMLLLSIILTTTTYRELKRN